VGELGKDFFMFNVVSIDAEYPDVLQVFKKGCVWTLQVGRALNCLPQRVAAFTAPAGRSRQGVRKPGPTILPLPLNLKTGGFYHLIAQSAGPQSN
jgi:hypothetical protein